MCLQSSVWQSWSQGVNALHVIEVKVTPTHLILLISSSSSLITVLSFEFGALEQRNILPGIRGLERNFLIKNKIFVLHHPVFEHNLAPQRQVMISSSCLQSEKSAGLSLTLTNKHDSGGGKQLN